MFLGLSLTTWAIVLGIFAIVTPIMGKEIATQSLEMKKSFKEYNPSRVFMFFPWSMIRRNANAHYNLPVQFIPEREYILWMMAGGVYAKFLLNLFILISISIAMFIIYFILPIAKIFSTK